MTSQPVRLIEGATGTAVDAVLWVGLSADRLIAAEAVWRPLRQALGLVQHRHWDWALKSGSLGTPGVTAVGIECGGQMQGLMMTDTRKRTASLPPDVGRPMLYVDYLEVAPWNVPTVGSPRYRYIGTRLMGTAVEWSVSELCGGRVGLHSLPQSEGFYHDSVGMTLVGYEPGYTGLAYFEFTAAAADQYLEG